MDVYAHQINDALQDVARLRQQQQALPALAQASFQVKQFQSRRFEATYADLLSHSRYRTAASFFLQELYGNKDYTQRDQQFARIASTITKIFPQQVVETAASLADVHALTERLDDLMARKWLKDSAYATQNQDCRRYIRAWRSVSSIENRQKQLELVLSLGRKLNRLTRKPGLRTLLRLMRRPAAVAGLDSLQGFLEAGFDAFAEMQGADEFLDIIRQRETAWINALFHDDAVACETKLTHLLDFRPPR